MNNFSSKWYILVCGLALKTDRGLTEKYCHVFALAKDDQYVTINKTMEHKSDAIEVYKKLLHNRRFYGSATLIHVISKSMTRCSIISLMVLTFKSPNNSLKAG